MHIDMADSDHKTRLETRKNQEGKGGSIPTQTGSKEESEARGRSSCTCPTLLVDVEHNRHGYYHIRHERCSDLYRVHADARFKSPTRLAREDENGSVVMGRLEQLLCTFESLDFGFSDSEFSALTWLQADATVLAGGSAGISRHCTYHGKDVERVH